MDYYLAIDIGSTSGRHMVGWIENGEIRQEEVYRFKNHPANKVNGHLTWDVEQLLRDVKEGLRCAFARYPEIRSLAIDTWGADYVLMDGDREILPVYTYRDSRTEEAARLVHEIVPFEEIYRRCGYQYGPYNTIYQLYDDKLQGRLEQATDFLQMPDYLSYKLCGVKVMEATDAYTTSLVSPYLKEFDLELTRKLGFPDRLFPKLTLPGTILGPLLPEVAEEVGGTCNVVMCASHDTESAISVIPMEKEQMYISSGTWSLLGVKIDEPITTVESAEAGFSNEGGMEYICYLTNIVGMWVVEQIRRELCPGAPFSEIVPQAVSSGFDHLVDLNDPRYTAPDSMTGTIRSNLEELGLPVPESIGDYFSCAYHSIAASYKRSIECLMKVTGRSYEKIYITGGGAKNDFLNRLTEQFTGMTVIPYPIEASSAGSILTQYQADHGE